MSANDEKFNFRLFFSLSLSGSWLDESVESMSMEIVTFRLISWFPLVYRKPAFAALVKEGKNSPSFACVKVPNNGASGHGTSELRVVYGDGKRASSGELGPIS